MTVMNDEQGKQSLGRRCVLGFLLYVGAMIAFDSLMLFGWETAPETWTMMTGLFWGLMGWVGVPRMIQSARNGNGGK
jgi:hypothetical protein